MSDDRSLKIESNWKIFHFSSMDFVDEKASLYFHCLSLGPFVISTFVPDSISAKKTHS